MYLNKFKLRIIKNWRLRLTEELKDVLLSPWHDELM